MVYIYGVPFTFGQMWARENSNVGKGKLNDQQWDMERVGGNALWFMQSVSTKPPTLPQNRTWENPSPGHVDHYSGNEGPHDTT
jgi:hypothetical protein